jgi:hypothetical protein
MFLLHVRAVRFAAAYLLFSVAFVLTVRKADIPETLFDEANTPTNEMVVERTASSWEYRQSVAAFVPGVFAETNRIQIRTLPQVYAGQSIDPPHGSRRLFCTLLC